jgi:hypothetical protein
MEPEWPSSQVQFIRERPDFIGVPSSAPSASNEVNILFRRKNLRHAAMREDSGKYFIEPHIRAMFEELWKIHFTQQES